jgi:sugar lactone lactonase YvrE
VREGGAVATTVSIDRGAFACMLGGHDGRTLYIVAANWAGMASLHGDVPWEGQVRSIRVESPGAGWPARG